MSDTNDFQPEESPVAWFVELLLSLDKGDYQKAALAQRELLRLGWNVAPHKSTAQEEER